MSASPDVKPQLSPEVMGQIRRIQIRAKRLVEEAFLGQYASVFRGQGMEFQEVRQYVPGDDVRNIDWNVTARTGMPHVKIMHEERELTVMLVLDLSGSGWFGSVSRFKNEVAAEICGALAFTAIRNNDKVGLLIFTDEVELYLRPDKGTKHVLRVIREALCFRPSRKGTRIETALRALNRLLPRRAVVFLVSDFMDSDYEQILRVTAKRHDLIAITLTDPREMSLPDVGPVWLEDAETGKQVLVNTSSARVRRQYEQAALERMEKRDSLLRKAGVDLVHVYTDRPWVSEMYQFFKLRERRLR
ncbi:MAG TPA: DUF58 domain-containing protein [Candidatus Hydrogenedentes bacterium]|nr:DUF58 domain-containing protein [Candidatus Hydrogenedentota bacterium]